MRPSDSDRAAIAAVLELFDDDPEAVDELVTAGIGTLAECVESIAAAAHAADADGLAHAAHRLKGAAATIGGARVSAASAAIERSARAGVIADAAAVARLRDAAAVLDADLHTFLTAPLDARRSLTG